MKVGFFGGSFDPPHRGHIALARLALERLGLDRLLIAPVGKQPLKGDEAASSPYEDRVAMVRLAIAGEPGMEVSLVDAPRPNEQPNYTVDTVRSLQQTIGVEDALYCLMGADSFLTIGNWRQSKELLVSCDFVVGSRPGFDLKRIAAALPSGISLSAGLGSIPGCPVVSLRSEDGAHSCLYLLPDLAEDVSATEIRSELRARVPAEVNPAVADYIAAHGLYRNSS
jgi:nicotinate-nucleotide adenylyltransferase